MSENIFSIFFNGGRDLQRLKCLGLSKSQFDPGRWTFEGNKELPGTWALGKKRDKVRDDKCFVTGPSLPKPFIHSVHIFFLLRAYPVTGILEQRTKQMRSLLLWGLYLNGRERACVCAREN